MDDGKIQPSFGADKTDVETHLEEDPKAKEMWRMQNKNLIYCTFPFHETSLLLIHEVIFICPLRQSVVYDFPKQYFPKFERSDIPL